MSSSDRRSRPSYALLTVLLLAIVPCAPAEEPAPQPVAPPYKQLRYDESYEYLRDPSRRSEFLDNLKLVPIGSGSSYLTLGGEARERYEYYHHQRWGDGPQDDDGYLLHRIMLHADAHVLDSVRFFIQLKSGLESDRTGGPRPTDRDDLDLNQAFVDIRDAWQADESVTLRAGRQEMSYGSSRLISFRESPNVRLSFDGVKIIRKSPDLQIDAFAVKPVRTNVNVFDDDPDPDRTFWGLYTVTPVPWVSGGNVDLYYLGISNRDAEFDQGTADERRHSLGTRLWGKHDGWDYNFELVYQLGRFGTGDIFAWTAASDTGFTFDRVLLAPRVALKANATSGDRSSNDADLQTFNPLFPRGAYLGEPALIGPANHIDVHPQLDLALTESATLTIDWDCFWRQSTDDGIYGPAVNVIVPGSKSGARYVGNQLELLLEWQITRHVTLAADYAHFFTGGFLEQTTSGKDVDYASAWTTFRF